METKVCTKCGTEKELSKFARIRRKDGSFRVLSKCNVCAARYATEWRKNNLSKAILSVRAYVSKNKERVASCKKKWRENNLEKHLECVVANANKHPEKTRASVILNNSIKIGKTIRPDYCSECGNHKDQSRIEAHHENYSRPLDVIWLCVICHGKTRRLELS